MDSVSSENLPQPPQISFADLCAWAILLLLSGPLLNCLVVQVLQGIERKKEAERNPGASLR